MRVLRVVADGFRNLEGVDLTLGERTTVVSGPNGQGKTNLLEALYFLLTLRPLRASKLSELVRFGAEKAHVAGEVLAGGAVRRPAVEIEPGRRAASLDGKRTSNLESYLGGLAVVAFTPDDLSVIKGSPERRRAFLDRSVFNRYPAFLKEVRAYTRALRARNRLLKDRSPAAYLQAYDEALARSGARIHLRRLRFMTELAPRVRRTFDDIARLDVPLELGYRLTHREESLLEAPALPDEATLMGWLLEALDRSRGRDLERGHTSVGPHADDLDFSLGAHPARAFASQGQQRALVLAWKIAEIENLAETLGFLPLLLLDDVSSELDPARNAHLLDHIRRSGAQVLLTTTDPALVSEGMDDQSVHLTVQAGRFTPA